MWGQSRSIAASTLFFLTILIVEPGCSNPGPRSLVGSSVTNSTEPSLSTESGTVIVEPPSSAQRGTAKSISFIDRHPLFRKPQQYYDNTKSNKVVKTAAAAFIGVPVGIGSELKQIVVGTPTVPVVPAY